VTTNLDKKIPLMEVFGPTVQGEGSVIGQQTYFLRFGLCDYKCVMCDSMHAVDPQQVKANAQWLTQRQIFEALYEFRSKQQHSTPWVTFSGGNPAIYDLQQLVDLLKNDGWKIAVETQGTVYHRWLLDCDVITVSPKTPGMGEKLELDKLDLFLGQFAIAGRYRDRLAIKMVVFDQIDLEAASMVFERYVRDAYGISASQFYLSLGNPYPPGTRDARASGVCLECGTPDLVQELVYRYEQLLPDIMQHPTLCRVKFLPQWHVLLWGNKQGV
jgi:7-carboxy-7-deazaguanine synthase